MQIKCLSSYETRCTDYKLKSNALFQRTESFLLKNNGASLDFRKTVFYVKKKTVLRANFVAVNPPKERNFLPKLVGIFLAVNKRECFQNPYRCFLSGLFGNIAALQTTVMRLWTILARLCYLPTLTLTYITCAKNSKIA